MKTIVSTLGVLVLYIGTIDVIEGDMATIELFNTRTEEVTKMDLPVDLIPCAAVEGGSILLEKRTEGVVIVCDTVGCE